MMIDPEQNCWQLFVLFDPKTTEELFSVQHEEPLVIYHYYRHCKRIRIRGR